MADRDQEKKLLAAALKRLERLKTVDCFDPIDLDSRPTEKQIEVLEGINHYKHRYVRAGNQTGKSQIGAREVSWLFEDTHPYWNRPEAWGGEPLLLIVVGRTSKQVEEVLWRKLKGFLTPGSYREQRSGGALQKVTHTENGNTIVFASHHSENEAREKLQAFVAHYVWIDEMPGSLELIEELHRRVQARNGYFLATFTPKVKNDEIRRYVDQVGEPVSNVYRLRMLDNPIYKDREEELLSQLEGYTEAYRNAILYGDWLTDENSVYEFNYDTMVAETLPDHYSSAWRHVEAVDPALKSKFGFILLAEDPETGFWYVVKADYVAGIYVPREMVLEIQKKTRGYNVTRRVSDTEPWFVNTATDMKVKPVYFTVSQKTQRKGELMKNLQAALGTKLKVCSWCTDLIDEFNSCRWSDTAADKIVNSQTYHLIDALQYGLDVLPAAAVTRLPVSRDDALRQAHEKRLAERAAEEQRSKSTGHRKQFRIKKVGNRWN